MTTTSSRFAILALLWCCSAAPGGGDGGPSAPVMCDTLCDHITAACGALPPDCAAVCAGWSDGLRGCVNTAASCQQIDACGRTTGSGGGTGGGGSSSGGGSAAGGHESTGGGSAGGTGGGGGGGPATGGGSAQSCTPYMGNITSASSDDCSAACGWSIKTPAVPSGKVWCTTACSSSASCGPNAGCDPVQAGCVPKCTSGSDCSAYGFEAQCSAAGLCGRN